MSRIRRQWWGCFLLFLIVAGILIFLELKAIRAKGEQNIEYVIGVSQANMREAWRLALTNEIEEEGKKYPNIRLITMDGTSDTEKQKNDVVRLLEFGIDLLIISPNDVEAMTPIISEVYQQIPVIVMDRAVEGFDYTLFIGPDNQLIGKKAAEGVLALLPNDSGNILEIYGSSFSQASRDRSRGFSRFFSGYDTIFIHQINVEAESKDATKAMILAMGTALNEIDCIFAHNDYMAFGAWEALNELGYQIPIWGVDGFIGKNKGIDLVKQEMLEGTITCPTGGKEAIQYALDILNNVSGVPKQVILRSHSIHLDNLDDYLQELDRIYIEKDGILDVGYAQVGAESAWRLANTRSIKEAARDAGINLIYEEGDQSQEKQIEAIRKFIQLGVDVIVISPVVDSGWDEVLTEAHQAGIPVLLSDRKIEVEDEQLFMTYIGADFIEEGKRALRWIVKNMESNQIINIMELQGTIGASPTIERNQGFTELLEDYPGYEIVYSESGDFTFEGGRDIVTNYLNDYQWDIDVIFAHNDDMALGAIEALEDYGIKPGVDVKIVSVDGTKDAFKAMIDGKLNCAVECNPLLGPQLMKAVADLVSGKELPLRIITEEKVYDMDEAAGLLKSRSY